MGEYDPPFRIAVIFFFFDNSQPSEIEIVITISPKTPLFHCIFFDDAFRLSNVWWVATTPQNEPKKKEQQQLTNNTPTPIPKLAGEYDPPSFWVAGFFFLFDNDLILI